MAETSLMMPIGTTAPHFELTDVRTGETVTEGDGPTLVMFICNHCPYVVHIRQGLVSLGADYAGSDIHIVGISSNDPDRYPDDAPERLAEVADEVGYRFPVVHDATQDVAKAYGAACTPDFFLFDGALELVYRGQFDGSRPNSNTPVTGEDLRAAIDAILAGDAVSSDQRPSMGCGIKWKPGNEPG